jgi:sugar O-acyltransferase (sialic acid O-acetyltransferase NeuD family)
MDKKIAIIGAGGFAKETLCCFIDSLNSSNRYAASNFCFMIEDEKVTGEKVLGVDVLPISTIDVEKHRVIVAIGDPNRRKLVVEGLPRNMEFVTVIHPSAVISEFASIGEGSIVTAGVIITCDITIGKHAHLNLHTTVGHDCVIGDYLTTTPGVNISGNCNFGEAVYFGTNASVKQGISICDRVTVGMGAVVLKNIEEPGTYVGNPLRKIK